MNKKTHDEIINSLNAEIEKLRHSLISDKEKLEQLSQENRNLRDRERKLQEMLEKIPEPFQSLDINGDILTVNERWCKELGYTKEEVIGRAFGNFLTPNSKQKYLQNFPKFKEKGHTSNVEFEMLQKNAKEISVSYDGVILYDDKGEMIQTECVFTNITEQKKIKNSLEIEKYRFQMAEKIANLGSWEQSFIDDTLEWSSEVYRIFEIDKANKMTFNNFIARVHPDDRESVNQTFQASVQDRKPYHLIHRLLLPDGRIKHILEHAKHFYDASNNHIYTIGTVQDITRQKEAETLLSKNKEMLSLIIDKSPIGICTVDLLGNFVSTNPTYEKMIGYSKKELNELSFFDITHPDYRPKNKELFQKMFSLETAGFNFEKIYIRKDGREISVSVHAVGVSDEAGNIKFGTAFVEDITEKKHAHNLLEQKKTELETIFNEAPSPMADSQRRW